MNDIQFWTGGELLQTSEDGMVAVLESEFIEWTVSWTVASDEPMFVRYGPEVLLLENHPTLPGRLRVPPKIRKKTGGRREEESRSKSYIGSVSLFKDEACTEPLTPMLRVHSTNLTREEFVEILEDLRNQVYAISIYSTHLQVMGADKSGAGDMMPLARFLRVLSALEPVIDVYRKQLRMIQRNPARRIVRVLKVMSIERAVSKGHVGQTFRVPEDRRKVFVVGRESTQETPEQRFINSTSSQLLLESRVVLSWLSSRLEERSRGEADAVTGQKFYPLVYGVREKFRAIQAKKGIHPKGISHAVDIRTAREMIARVSKKIEGLQIQVGNPQMDIEGTRVRTNKLEMSSEYAPVLRAWTEFSSQSTGFDRTNRLLNELDERTVAPSSILYERWVTIRIYSELLRRGFHPEIGQANLIELMSVTDGEVVLQRGALDISLTGEFSSKSVGVRIRHEPILNRKDGGGIRTPDLVLDITATQEGKNASLISQVWVLDAKFKNYRVPAPYSQLMDADLFGSHFFADLLGVAEHKYRRGLGVFGSAIVHPDISPGFLYLDDSKLNKWRKDHIESPAAHTVLALPLRPGSEADSQVSRIFKVIFGYHMHLDNICWICGSEGEQHPVPGVSQGDGYSCPGCGAFWISHRCFECHHEPLLKFASGPIHRTEVGQPFNVHCPECGAYFEQKSRSVTTI